MRPSQERSQKRQRTQELHGQEQAKAKRIRKESTSLRTKTREDSEAEMKIGQHSTSLHAPRKEAAPENRHDCRNRTQGCTVGF